MPVLRSRKSTTPVNMKMTPESSENGCYEPSTPAKTPEVLNKKTDNSTPSSIVHGANKELGFGSEGKSVRGTGTVGRRSLRLAEKTPVGLNNVGENGDRSIHKRKDVCPEDGTQFGNLKNDSVDDSESESDDLCMSVKRVRVTEEVGGEINYSGDTVQSPAKGEKTTMEGLQGSGVFSGQNGEISEGEKRGKGKRRSGMEKDRTFLNLRSGKRLSKRIVEEERGHLNVPESSIKEKNVLANTGLPNVSEHGVGQIYEIGVETRIKYKTLDEDGDKLVDSSIISSNGFETLEQRPENGDAANDNGVKTRTRSRLDKGKEKLVDNSFISTNGFDTLEPRLENGDGTNDNGVRTRSQIRFIDISEPIEVGVGTRSSRSRLDKGKGKMIELKDSVGGSNSASPAENVTLQVDNNVPAEKRSIRERFREMAKQNASRFAHYVAEEEQNTVADDTLGENSPSEDGKMEDWPGPFSTAMKIIKDRETNRNTQQQIASTGKSKASPKWVPKRGPEFECRLRSVPSLQDMCWPVLVNNADAITSLDFIPEVLKHKLSQLLCDSRRMNCHILELLVSGSPTEIRVRECSWLTEENFTRIFEPCDTSNLTVLQLDLCGCCLADYILYTTFASSPNSLPALTNISLKGAYRISDTGLSTLAASAPCLRSINLSQCSLVTSDGINCLADSLGPVLRDLYINECQGINAMLILPALLKMQHLEVLSVASIETVNDSFVSKFVTAQGHNLKELNLKDCMKLTDTSVKAIAENCSSLCSIDLSNLRKLTDDALGYLANGCRTMHTLKLARNLFSDEAVAAYIETCGDYLKELSLNYVKKVADNASVSLAKCSKLLHTLDLSFCRNLSNEDLGLIVDSCSSLRVLKLFGCSQVKDVFLSGHSNPHVQIIGLKMTSVVQHLKDPILPQATCY